MCLQGLCCEFMCVIPACCAPAQLCSGALGGMPFFPLSSREEGFYQVDIWASPGVWPYSCRRPVHTGSHSDKCGTSSAHLIRKQRSAALPGTKGPAYTTVEPGNVHCECGPQ